MDVYAGMHVGLHCENHPNQRWSCKLIAVSPNYRYNGCRNVFYSGELRDGEWVEPTPPECSCPGGALVVNDDCKQYVDTFHAK
jgi:hypothetical protein